MKLNHLLKLAALCSVVTSLNSCANVPEGFFRGVGVELKTDYGNLHGSKSGVEGSIIIDQRSGK